MKTNRRVTMISGVKFAATLDELALIRKIVERVAKLYPDNPLDVQSSIMDMDACHSNGCPLDLVRMAGWERDLDLIHDVYGIRNTLDRSTGKIVGLFHPRFAVQQ